MTPDKKANADTPVMSSEAAAKKKISELFKILSTRSKGLSSSEAEKRLLHFGPNEIQGKRINPLLKFLGYFWGPIPIMIEVAAILSLIIHHLEDFWIILVLLMINAVVAFWQEYKANNAIDALKQKLALKARILRDSKWKTIAAAELVPGDVIGLKLGDIIPADVKLMNGDYLLIDESSLTGESLPVEKHKGDIGYSGAVVSQGEMTGLVVCTGMNTFFGRTAKLVEEAGSRSHFQKAVVKIGDYLILLALFLVLIVFLFAIFRHENFLETLQFALVLTVAAIPVALPAVLSVTMAVGAVALAKMKAIVSKLVAIEEMAGMDVLCSDKTGTITKNEIRLANVIPLGKHRQADVLLAACLATKDDNRDPIDQAVWVAYQKQDKSNQLSAKYKKIKFIPFDPISKRTEATIQVKSSATFRVTKGAAPQIISLCKPDWATSNRVKKMVDDFASKGYRSLAVARSAGKKWKLIGLLALNDPPRDDSAETIKNAQEMGVDVKMITGDHAAIAREICRNVHLGTNIIEAPLLLKASAQENLRLIEKADGFAQVLPEHKYRIVEALQAGGHIVGMTGDGVNDAPALKKADVGIAVEGATDAARSAADIVLTKPGLSVIVDAIHQSRKIFQRMTNYSIYRITETIRVLIFITASIMAFRFYPVTALMIVLLALLNDAPIMSIAYDNVKYSQKPEKWNMGSILRISTFLGLVGVFMSFFILYIGRDIFHLSREILQSFIYLKLSVAGHLTVFVARTRGPFWSIKPSKLLLFAVLATQFIATLIVVYGFLLPAMGWKLALFVWGYALVAFVITDFLKVKFYRLLDHSQLKFKQ